MDALLAELIPRFQAVGVRLRTNRNRHTVVSLRHQRRGPPVLSVHEGLIAETTVISDLLRFAVESGHGDYPALRSAMSRLPRGPRAGRVELPLEQVQALPVVGSDCDFEACFREIHARFFAHLPRPFFRWGRDPGDRQLRHLRYACYLRHPHAAVRLSPRLARPWVARVFVEHVLHHELCHHQQACDPVPGEAPHSARFKRMERSFPQFDVAMAWEARHVTHLLAPE